MIINIEVKKYFKLNANKASSLKHGVNLCYRFIKQFPYYYDEDFDEMCKRLEEVLYQNRTKKNDLTILLSRHSVLPHQEPYIISKDFSKELDE